jgi:hypothetical protein
VGRGGDRGIKQIFPLWVFLALLVHLFHPNTNEISAKPPQKIKYLKHIDQKSEKMNARVSDKILC